MTFIQFLLIEAMLIGALAVMIGINTYDPDSPFVGTPAPKARRTTTKKLIDTLLALRKRR